MRRLCVVLDEHCGNMIRHDPDLDETYSFDLALAASAGEIEMQIADPGSPFDPVTFRAEPQGPVGGHGLDIIRRFAKRIAYERQYGRNLLVVVLDPADSPDSDT